MARGKHLIPFRTEQLSPSAPMVLGSQGPGRVGRRRFFSGNGLARPPGEPGARSWVLAAPLVEGSRRAPPVMPSRSAAYRRRWIRSRRDPLGVATSTTSPTSWPMSALATGELADSRPCERSASAGPTRVQVLTVSVPSSTTSAVRPNSNVLPSVAMSVTTALRSRCLSRLIWVSMWAWSSLAAWYSAFSERSPSSRAVRIRWAMARRPLVSRSWSSRLRASRPSALIGSPSEGAEALMAGQGGWRSPLGHAAMTIRRVRVPHGRSGPAILGNWRPTSRHQQRPHPVPSHHSRYLAVKEPSGQGDLLNVPRRPRLDAIPGSVGARAHHLSELGSCKHQRHAVFRGPPRWQLARLDQPAIGWSPVLLAVVVRAAAGRDQAHTIV